jgi:hypothetical protein
MPHLSANIIVCETALYEKTDVPSAIRIMTAIGLPPGNNFARFSTLTFLSSLPRDFEVHTLQIQMTDQAGRPIGHGEPYQFNYGYRLDISGPGAFMLKTDFNLDTTPIGLPANCLITAHLDNQAVAWVPLMLRRG